MTERAAIEIHDSTLQRLDYVNETLVATVAAYLHRSEGRPGVDVGTGWSQTVEIRFLAGRIAEGRPDLPMELLGGRFRVSGETLNNVVPPPLVGRGRVTAEFESYAGRRLLIEALGVELIAVGEPRYIEEFTPPSGPTDETA